MNAKIAFRNLATEDVLPVLRLGTQNFDWPSESILWDESVVRWFVDNARSFSFVAAHGNEIIGFILCSSRDRRGYVAWIAVDAQWRQKGVASRLMHRALLAFQLAGIETVSGLVREDGIADHLFEECGFRSSEFRKLDMTLNLAGVSTENE